MKKILLLAAIFFYVSLLFAQEDLPPEVFVRAGNETALLQSYNGISTFRPLSSILNWDSTINIPTDILNRNALTFQGYQPAFFLKDSSEINELQLFSVSSVTGGIRVENSQNGGYFDLVEGAGISITKNLNEAVIEVQNGLYESAFSKNTAFNKNFGTASGTVLEGNNKTLIDANTAKRTYPLADENKLAGIQAGATITTVENILTSISTTNALSAAQGKVLKDAQDSHIANTSNPHSVTKSQVGLSNVDNTSDVNKPISSATQSALDLKYTIGNNLDMGGSELTNVGAFNKGAGIMIVNTPSPISFTSESDISFNGLFTSGFDINTGSGGLNILLDGSGGSNGQSLITNGSGSITFGTPTITKTLLNKSTTGTITPSADIINITVSGTHDIDILAMSSGQSVIINNNSGGTINLGTTSLSIQYSGSFINGGTRHSLLTGESIIIYQQTSGSNAYGIK